MGLFLLVASFAPEPAVRERSRAASVSVNSSTVNETTSCSALETERIVPRRMHLQVLRVQSVAECLTTQENSVLFWR